MSPEPYDPAGPLLGPAMTQLPMAGLSTSEGLMADSKAAVTLLLYFGQDLPCCAMNGSIVS